MGTQELRRLYDHLQTVASYWRRKTESVYDKYIKSEVLSRDEKKLLAKVKSCTERFDKIMSEVLATSTVFQLESRKAFQIASNISVVEAALDKIETEHADVMDEPQCKILDMEAHTSIDTVHLYMSMLAMADISSEDSEALMNQTIKAYKNAKCTCEQLRACIVKYSERKVERA